MEIKEASEILDISPVKEDYNVEKIKYDTEEEIQVVEELYRNIPTDMTVKKNYDFVKDGAKKVKKLISATEKRRKELKADALDYGRKVDSIAKKISGRFKVIYDPMKKIIVDHETKEEIKKRETERIEKERQEKIELRINKISGLASELMLSTADVIKSQMELLELDDANIWAEEYSDKVVELKKNTMIQLDELFRMKSQTENAKKREEERKEKEKKEREEEQKAIMVENARLAAENKKNADALEAANKIIAEQAARVESEKIAKEQAKEEAEKIAKEKIEAEKFAIAEAEAEKERIAIAKAEVERLIIKKQAFREAETAAWTENDRLKAGRKKAIDLTITQVVAEFSEAAKLGEEEEAFAFGLIQAVISNNFKHLKWID